MLTFTNITSAKKDSKLSYLGSINSSAKILKNQTVSQQMTYILYLSPYNLSGYNVCSHSTLECRMGCLATSGRAGIGVDNKIQKARLIKTRLFHQEQDFFMEWMIEEIKTYQKKAIKDNYGFSIRLNGTSDIDWGKVKFKGKNIFDIFPSTQFYDYTKNINKFKNKPTNYHLTYSYTGNNWDKCEQLLDKGYNVAMIFNKELPAAYVAYNVIDGDKTDFRPNDGSGVIVGLKWKRISDKIINQQIKTSKFVIQ